MKESNSHIKYLRGEQEEDDKSFVVRSMHEPMTIEVNCILERKEECVCVCLYAQNVLQK